MQITEDELIKCKRAVLMLVELAGIATTKANVTEPINVKHDRVVLLQVLKRLEKIATKGDAR